MEENQAFLQTQYFGFNRPARMLVISLNKLREILEANENRWAAGKCPAGSLAEDIMDTLLEEAVDLDNPAP